MNRCLLLLTSLAVLAPMPVAAQDEVQGRVRVSLGVDGPVWAGEQVTVNLDLMTTGLSFSNTHFSLPQLDGAFLLRLDSSTVKLTERIDGASWQTVRYPLAVFAQTNGTLAIPSFEVRFRATAGFGTEPRDFGLRTDPLSLTVRWPPGAAEGGIVVTTSDFDLRHAWSGDGTSMKPGDAITLTVTQSAASTSGMLLPPLPVYRTDGIAAYPQAPEVEDRSNRGSSTGTRRDSITWVVERAGSYRIPGVRYQWWNPVTETLEQRTVPGREVEVAPLASESTGPETVASPASTSRWTRPALYVFAVTILFALTAWLNRARIGAWLARRRQRREAGEPWAFGAVEKAIRARRPAEAYAAISVWLSRWRGETAPPTLSRIARESGNAALLREAEALQAALLDQANWNGDALLRELRALRGIPGADLRTRDTPLAPSLNPR